MTSEMTREFAITVRGYDRVQVDDYIDTLGQWLNNATIRMEAAEAETAQLGDEVVSLRSQLAEVDQQASEQPPRTLVALGERVTRILQLAEEGADAVLADAEADARAMVARANEEADDVVRAARAQRADVEAVVASARQQAAAAVQQAEAHAAEAVARLTTESEARAAKLEVQADHQARQMVADAEAEATRILDQAAAQRARLEVDLQRLSAERADVLAGLAKLRESLQMTIGAVPDDHPGVASGAPSPVGRPEEAVGPTVFDGDAADRESAGRSVVTPKDQPDPAGE